MSKRQWILCFFLTSLCIWVYPKEGMIQIKGSDTMVNLVQSLAEKIMEKSPEQFIAVTGGGSGTGLSALLNGTCDIAMSSRNIKQKEIEMAKKKGIDPNEIKIALDGLAVVIHPSNPVSSLSTEQLADIFTGKVKNWKEIGGKDSKIVLLSREVNSGTHVYFKEHVLRKNNPASTEEFAPDALLLSSSQAIADEVANNPDAIGYYGMGYISNKQKAVKISMSANLESIAPTVENVTNGSYPISRPLFFYTNGKPNNMIKQFIDFCLSEEGQKMVLQNDFVPLKNK
jgi:phosphate transport system substrate-binding protein